MVVEAKSSTAVILGVLYALNPKNSGQGEEFRARRRVEFQI